MNNWKDLDQSLIEKLGLTDRLLYKLHRNGIFTIGLLEEFFENGKLEKLSFISQKRLNQISYSLKRFKGESHNEFAKHKLDNSQITSQSNYVTKTWAVISQSYFEGERETYTYILLSRFIFKPKTLQELAEKFHISRERVRQIQERATLRFLRYVNFAGSNQLLERILKIFSRYEDDLSLEMFRGILTEEKLLGYYSQSFMSQRDFIIDPFEILINWLKLLSNERYSNPPTIFPIDINMLIPSNTIAISDYKKILKLNPKLRRRILHEVYFNGGINIYEASKILLTDKDTTESFLRGLNLRKNEDNLYSLKN
jgi:hypothetical protein